MNTKYIFVTGGVVSGLGKGITAASLGRLLKNRGYIVDPDKMTDSMKEAIDETARRRSIQEKYNKEHNIIPKTIKKNISEVISNIDKTKINQKKYSINKIEELEKEMREAAKNLDFERAMELRDIIFEIKK